MNSMSSMILSNLFQWIDSDAELCAYNSFTFTHENNKRVPFPYDSMASHDEKKQSIPAKPLVTNFVNRYQVFHLPLFLTVELWNRHGYSLRDVEITLSKFKSSYHLWCLALNQNLSIANSAVKPSFDSETSTVFGGAAIVRRNLLRHFQLLYQPIVLPNGRPIPFPSLYTEKIDMDTQTTMNLLEKKIHSIVMPTVHGVTLNINDSPMESKSILNLPSILTFPKDPHRPPLPVHELSDGTLFQSIVQSTPKPNDMKKQYSHFWIWRGIRLVPTQWFPSQSIVLMVRIVPEPIFTFIYGKPKCFTLQPSFVNVEDHLFALTEEACYFTSIHTQQTI